MGLLGISFKSDDQKEENYKRNLKILQDLLKTQVNPKTEELNNTVNNLIETYKMAILLKKDNLINDEQYTKYIKDLPRFHNIINMGTSELKLESIFGNDTLELFRKNLDQQTISKTINDNNRFESFLDKARVSITNITKNSEGRNFKQAEQIFNAPGKKYDITSNTFTEKKTYKEIIEKINNMNNKFENLTQINNLINLTKDKIEPTYNVLQKINELQDTINKNNLNKTTKQEQEFLDKYNNTIKNNKRLLTKEEAKYYNQNIDGIAKILESKSNPKSNIGNHNQTPVSSRYKN